MKSYFLFLLTTAILLFNSCSNGQTKVGGSLLADAFADKLKQTKAAQIVDVRTPGEFEKGHLLDALNFNWNSDDFQNQVLKLDKSKPVFVYCLSGGRSEAAANKMRSDGFLEVYELSGGMMKWRAAGLPETTVIKSELAGMTKAQFEALLNTNKIVLIDFYADWCVPCKKMKPYLDEIAMDMQDKVKVIGINVDDNKALCQELKIDGLPVIQLYKNKVLTFTNTGFLNKAEIEKQIN